MKFLDDIIKYGKLQNYKTEMDIDENRIQKLNMYLLSSSDPLNHQYEQQYGNYSSTYVNNTRNRNLTGDIDIITVNQQLRSMLRAFQW